MSQLMKEMEAVMEIVRIIKRYIAVCIFVSIGHQWMSASCPNASEKSTSLGKV